ncbi:hypothetical protein [Halobacillus amylolyticus]|uniref:O-antigen polymerase n=1 Tax=Halobacillus amylolyticus TaxID=2932259 RepID=A0ABY4H8Q4_9BACI|nr:hypothetical protein [Halobacillus amylolyticus]UOR11084.1 hypothetical protein MUO15_15995 [Halobacillus amylolyticus]
MVEYFWLIPLVSLIILVLHGTKEFPKIYKIIGDGYFFILTVVFIVIRERISYLYEEPPIPDIYWGKNSAWAEVASWLYLLPAAVIMFIAYCIWFENTSGVKNKVLLSISIIPVIFIFITYTIVFGLIYGYRP